MHVHVFDGRKLIGLWAAAVLAGLLMMVTAGCGWQDDFTEPVALETVAPSKTAGPPSPPVAAVELVQATATPYSQSVPSPVVVTATPAVELAEPVSAQDIDCGDFGDWIEAQEFFLWNGGPGEDPNMLDTDMDGIACNAETDRGYEFRVFASSDIPPPTPVMSEVAATATVGSPQGAQPTAVPVATSAVQQPPTQSPIATPVTAGDWPTPEEVGAIELGKFKERGYFYKFVSSGRTIHVYESPKRAREVTCGPEIGTAFDSSNPTWSDSSHWIYVWSVKVGWGSGSCLGISKYEDWANKPLPAPPLERRDWDDLFVKWGAPLKFALDDTVRDFSLANWRDAHYVVHDRIVLEDGWVSKCDETTLPWAAWGRERGFYTISIEDEEAMKRQEWTDEQVARKEEGRARGLYFIYKGLGAEFGDGNYCWHVPNHEEIPPHRPCLECQWRDW